MTTESVEQTDADSEKSQQRQSGQKKKPKIPAVFLMKDKTGSSHTIWSKLRLNYKGTNMTSYPLTLLCGTFLPQNQSLVI